MLRFCQPVVALALLASASGCLGTRDVFHPGDERTQVVRAQIYDPYPENDLGPAIVGGRPPGFDSPRAEVLRVQPRHGEPLLVPAPPQAANAGCPPGYAPAYGPVYAPGAAQGYSPGTTAIVPPNYNTVPGLVAPPEQPGNVIYVPPPTAGP